MPNHTIKSSWRYTIRHFPIKVVTIPALILVIVSCFSFFNRLLHFKKLPKRSVDCIIVLYGPAFDLRKNEANRLVKEGLASVVYYPLTNRFKDIVPHERAVKTHRLTNVKTSYWKLRKHADLKYLENTHIELMVAKAFVQRNRLQRVMIVSSPYHMRRVKLIAERVFEPGIDIYFSSPDTYTRGLAWLQNWQEVRWVFHETLKIGWFLFYWHFLPID